MPDSINDALKTAKRKLLACLRERDRLNNEIEKWERVVESLSAVTVDSSADLPPDIVVVSPFFGDKKPMGFTDGVRDVLRRAEVIMTAPQIRNELERMGFDFSKYAQPLVPLHNTLKRLQEQKEIVSIKNQAGETTGYQWINPIVRAVKEERSWLADALGKPVQPPPGVRGSFGRTVQKTSESEGVWEQVFGDDKKKK
jgi:hypothetical protein